MVQLVREPTRHQYLLDLIRTDIAGAKASVGPYIADHKFCIAKVPMPKVTCLTAQVQRFNTLKANWTALEQALSSADWRPLRGGAADEAATYFQELL